MFQLAEHPTENQEGFTTTIREVRQTMNESGEKGRMPMERSSAEKLPIRKIK